MVPRQQKVGLSNDPVERKLHAQLDAQKRKFAKMAEESQPANKDDESSDEDDEPQSRTQAFVKKKITILPSSSQKN